MLSAIVQLSTYVLGVFFTSISTNFWCREIKQIYCVHAFVKAVRWEAD